jgi:hypothetical protein
MLTAGKELVIERFPASKSNAISSAIHTVPQCASYGTAA